MRFHHVCIGTVTLSKNLNQNVRWSFAASTALMIHSYSNQAMPPPRS
ncbi:Uncharacterised protein [Vibrio cholerae]|nr:Uncharacterised protein [Vibrio cholerae]